MPSRSGDILNPTAPSQLQQACRDPRRHDAAGVQFLMSGTSGGIKSVARQLNETGISLPAPKKSNPELNPGAENG
jgi:hypothetical protein